MGKTERTWQRSNASLCSIALHTERQKTQITTTRLIRDGAFMFPTEVPETSRSCELPAYPCTNATQCIQDALNLFYLLRTRQRMCPVHGNPSDISPSYSAQQPCMIAAACCHGSGPSGISSEISSVAEDTLAVLLEEKHRAKDPVKDQEAPQPRLQWR